MPLVSHRNSAMSCVHTVNLLLTRKKCDCGRPDWFKLIEARFNPCFNRKETVTDDVRGCSRSISAFSSLKHCSQLIPLFLLCTLGMCNKYKVEISLNYNLLSPVSWFTSNINTFHASILNNTYITYTLTHFNTFYMNVCIF